MPPTTCPSCQHAIPDEDINVGENTAYCRNCSSPHAFSDLVRSTVKHEPVDPSNPPKGVRFENNGISYVIKVSRRSFPKAVFLLFFSGFWNIIISIFVFGIIGGWISYASGTVPAWFPAPAHNGPRELGILIFMTLFIIPFLVVGFITAMMVLDALFGSSRVVIRGNDGRSSTGFAILRKTKRFDASTVRSVTLETIDSPRARINIRHIVIEAGMESITLGSEFNQTQKRWVASMLHELLVPTRR